MVVWVAALSDDSSEGSADPPQLLSWLVCIIVLLGAPLVYFLEEYIEEMCNIAAIIQVNSRCIMNHYKLPSGGILAYVSEETESQIPDDMRGIPENKEALFAPLVFPYYK